MYSNAGKSIKEYVKVIVTLSMIFWIVIGIAVWVIINRNGEGGMIFGLLIAGAGCVSSWLSGLVLYAYGDIADNIKCMKEALVPNSRADASVRAAAPAKPAAQSGGNSQQAPKANAVKWKCYSCGHENENAIAYCVACNVSRRWSEAQWSKNK